MMLFCFIFNHIYSLYTQKEDTKVEDTPMGRMSFRMHYGHAWIYI